jgi:hypothetical protein
LVGRRFHDLLSGLFDGDQRPPEIRHGRQVGELAQYVVEDVQAVADGGTRKRVLLAIPS